MSRLGRLTVTLAAALWMASPLQAQDSAAVAWNAGDLATAERLYAARLAEDSTDIRALHRLGLMHGWSERYAESLQWFDRLTRLAPRNLDARVDRARVLAWAGRLPEATDALGALVNERNAYRPARAELARFLTWRGLNDSARAIYDGMLARNSTDLDALRGRARVAAWSGDLRAGETGWYEALAVDPSDREALVGLSQTLRWQGRAAAALEAIERIQPAQLPHRDVNTELLYLRHVVAPRMESRLTYEGDSDGNRIGTMALHTAWRPVRRVELRVDAYVRDASQDAVGVLDQRSRGGTATVRAFPEPGWSFWLGAGISSPDGSARSTVSAFTAGVSTPSGMPVGASVSFQRRALDATAVLIDRGVRFGQMEANLRAEPGPRWSLAGGFAHATFTGVESNRRLSGTALVRWRHSREWQFGSRVRAFGFQRDLQEGYFDPSFYGQAEALATWRRERNAVRVNAELAPGLQQIGSSGALQATLRLSGEVSYEPVPGRRLGISALYSTSGALQGLATGGAGYRYVVVSLSGAWVF